MKRSTVILDGKRYQIVPDEAKEESFRLVPIDDIERPPHLVAAKCAFNAWMRSDPPKRGAYKSASAPLLKEAIPSLIVRAVDTATRVEADAGKIARTYVSQEALDQVVSFLCTLQGVRVKAAVKSAPEWATWQDISAQAVQTANEYNRRLHLVFKGTKHENG